MLHRRRRRVRDRMRRVMLTWQMSASFRFLFYQNYGTHILFSCSLGITRTSRDVGALRQKKIVKISYIVTAELRESCWVVWVVLSCIYTVLASQSDFCYTLALGWVKKETNKYYKLLKIVTQRAPIKSNNHKNNQVLKKETSWYSRVGLDVLFFHPRSQVRQMLMGRWSGQSEKTKKENNFSWKTHSFLIIIIYQASGGALVQYLTARKVASVTTQWSYDHLLQRSSAYEWSYSDHMRNQYIWYRWIYRVIRKVIFVYYIRLSYIWRTNVYMRVPFNIL